MKRPNKNLLIMVFFMGFLGCTFHNYFRVKKLSNDIYLYEGSSIQGIRDLEIKNEILPIIPHITSDKYYPELNIINPYNETIFPPNIASPTFIWEDEYLYSNMWLIKVSFENNSNAIYILTDQQTWTPDRDIWGIIKAHSISNNAVITIMGVNRKNSFAITTKSSISISTSKDEVDAPIFYMQMPLPFAYAKNHPELSRWLLGDISSYNPPPVIMENLPICGNCHSFSRDGKIFGMDMDYKNDKGAYVLTPVRENILLSEEDFISWNDFRRWDETKSLGLFSKISPDGNYVISTVKEKSFFVMIDDLDFSQLFFPLTGLIAYYSRKEKKVFALSGADDPDYVQTCPEWSPDGKFIVFSRAKVNKKLIEVIGDKGFLEIKSDIRIEDLNEHYQIQYDLYRIPFNRGKGGTPEPLIGASNNGKSNYFPRYSPDGKWIVFTRCKTGLAIQPKSQLYIIPAQGGIARKMRCNTDIMNSWHSWSPNSRWLVFTSKINTPFTELFLTHIDRDGNDSPAVLLDRFNSRKYAAMVPEFVTMKQGDLMEITLVGFKDKMNRGYDYHVLNLNMPR